MTENSGITTAQDVVCKSHNARAEKGMYTSSFSYNTDIKVDS